MVLLFGVSCQTSASVDTGQDASFQEDANSTRGDAGFQESAASTHGDAGSLHPEASPVSSEAGPTTTGDGLLSGCTVDASNHPTCTIPSGWTDVINEGFEGGQLGNAGQESICQGCSISTTNPHSGSYSVTGLIQSDGGTTAWSTHLRLAPFTDVYVSWWEFQQADGKTPGQSYGGCPDQPSAVGHEMNDENFLLHFGTDFSDGNYQFLDVDRYPQAGASDPNCTFTYNGTTYPLGENADCSQVLLVAQYTESGGVVHGFYGHTTPKGQEFGHWNQWEAWIHPNSPGNSDGFFNVWLNGGLIANQANIDMNGSLNMSSGTQVLSIDNVYTRFVWARASGYCYTFGCSGEGTQYAPRCTDFTVAGCPPFGSPAFKRWEDDIIVMKR